MDGHFFAKANEFIVGAYQIITKAKGSFALVNKYDALVKAPVCFGDNIRGLISRSIYLLTGAKP